MRSSLGNTTFGAVTEFSLPGQERTPNAIAAGADGSVWFGEESVPGLGHLFPNGTLVEYAFPGRYDTSSASGYSCSIKTSIWSIAIWGGRIWADDVAKNRLLGLSPGNDTFEAVNLPGNNSFPYTMTVGPDGALWFTQILSHEIGTLMPNGTLDEHAIEIPTHVQGLSSLVNLPGTPAQIAFAGDTGYFVDVSSVVQGMPIYSFDPSHFDPVAMGGNETLYSPDSISLGGGGVWIAEHAASSIAFYDQESRTWTFYPTSTVSYVGATLPYFVSANGSSVWFNEHYGNRISEIDPKSQTLTEYSISDPPANNFSQIGNAQTLVRDGGDVWFTELTANKVGFVDASRPLPFSLSLAGADNLTLGPGGTNTVRIELQANKSVPLTMQFSDSEDGTGTPQKILLASNVTGTNQVTGDSWVSVSIKVGADISPGSYLLALTATDGLVSRSAYVHLNVP